MSELEGATKGSVNGRETTSLEAFTYARENGLQVIYPMRNELFIDIDSEEAYQTYLKNFAILQTTFALWERSKTKSRRKPAGFHIVVTVGAGLKPYDVISPIERIALQAALGSDPSREAHSLHRLKHGDTLPTLFFERPEDVN